MREVFAAHDRVLGIDPTHRGFGFAVVERADHLVDWGSKQVSAYRRNRRCVAAVLALIRAYSPDAVALEDWRAKGSRRCSRVRALIRMLRCMAAEHTVPVCLVGPREVREVCAGEPQATKHRVADSLSKRFPALARRLPPRRKPWMSEDARMAVFDAVGLAVAALDGRGKIDLHLSRRARDEP